MATEVSETANAFAETACKLLTEYTARLVTQKQEVVKILDQLHSSRTSEMDSTYLRQRYTNEWDEFWGSKVVFEGLCRKASQWIEHGKSPEPNLELELEVRLADFENKLQTMHDFFDSNRV
jgi:hypothetical protein